MSPSAEPAPSVMTVPKPIDKCHTDIGRTAFPTSCGGDSRPDATAGRSQVGAPVKEPGALGAGSDEARGVLLTGLPSEGRRQRTALACLWAARPRSHQMCLPRLPAGNGMADLGRSRSPSPRPRRRVAVAAAMGLESACSEADFDGKGVPAASDLWSPDRSLPRDHERRAVARQRDVQGRVRCRHAVTARIRGLRR